MMRTRELVVFRTPLPEEYSVIVTQLHEDDFNQKDIFLLKRGKVIGNLCQFSISSFIYGVLNEIERNILLGIYEEIKREEEDSIKIASEEVDETNVKSFI